MSSALTTIRRPFRVGGAGTLPLLLGLKLAAPAVVDDVAARAGRAETAATSSRFSAKHDGSTPARCSAALSCLIDQPSMVSVGAGGGVRPLTGTDAIGSSSIASSSASSASASIVGALGSPSDSTPTSSSSNGSALSSWARSVRASADDSASDHEGAREPSGGSSTPPDSKWKEENGSGVGSAGGKQEGRGYGECGIVEGGGVTCSAPEGMRRHEEGCED
eukprot:scaffold173528_cov31-Tisochrysis_lutea.AAC.5